MRTHMPYIGSATRQRWHSHLYPSRSWYSIKWPQRDARLSLPRCVCVLCSKERFVEHCGHSQVQLVRHSVVRLLSEWDVASCGRPSRPKLLIHQWLHFRCTASGVLLTCYYYTTTVLHLFSSLFSRLSFYQKGSKWGKWMLKLCCGVRWPRRLLCMHCVRWSVLKQSVFCLVVQWNLGESFRPLGQQL